MEHYLKITVRRDEKIAREILKRGWMLQLFLLKQRGLYRMVRTKVKGYIIQEEKMFFITQDEGDKKYIESELAKFQNFLFSDEKDMDQGFKSLAQDRWVQKVANRIRKVKEDVKDKAIKASLQGNTVMGFFNRVGILIEYETGEMPGKNKVDKVDKVEKVDIEEKVKDSGYSFEVKDEKDD